MSNTQSVVPTAHLAEWWRGSHRPTATTATLVDRLEAGEVLPSTLFPLIAGFAIESRRAGQRPEEMVVRLKALYVSTRPALGAHPLWSTTAYPADSLWSFIVGRAIEAYFHDNGP